MNFPVDFDGYQGFKNFFSLLRENRKGCINFLLEFQIVFLYLLLCDGFDLSLLENMQTTILKKIVALKGALMISSAQPLASLPSISEPGVNRDILQTKHRLMYLEIRMMEFFKNCLQNLSFLQIHEDTLRIEVLIEKATKTYRQCDHILFIPRSMPVHYADINQLLDNHLEPLYEIRLKLIRLLESCLCRWSSDDLNQLWQKIEEDSKAIFVLNTTKEVPESTLTTWEKKLDNFQQIFRIKKVTESFQTECGSAFQKVMRKAEIVALYLSWEQALQLFGPSVCKDSKSINIHTALKILFFLSNHKEAFFQEFFNHDNRLQSLCVCDETVTQSLSNREGKFEVSQLIQALTQRIRENKSKNVAYEKRLISHITPSTYYTAVIIRLFTVNYYARTANYLVESQERATQEAHLRHITILSTPLQEPYLKISKTMTTIGLFAMDVVQWRWMGISQSMLFSMAFLLIPSIDLWTVIFQQFGADEKVAILCLPIIFTLFELSLYVVINGYNTGLNTHTVTLLMGSYLLAKLACYACGKVTDLFYRTIHQNKMNPEDSPTYPFVRGMAQWICFPLVNRFMIPYLLDKWNEKFLLPQDMLTNENNCRAHHSLCKKEACEFLGLPVTASLKDIKTAFSEQARKFHPDHNPYGEEMYQRLVNAKKICKEI